MINYSFFQHIYEQRIAKNQELKAENDWLRSYVVTSWGDVFINSFFRVFRNSFQDKNQRAGENCVRTEDTWDNMMTRLRDEKVAEGTIINDKIELVVNNIVKEYPLFNKEKEYLKNILKTALTSGFTDIEVKEFCSSPFQETWVQAIDRSMTTRKLIFLVVHRCLLVLLTERSTKFLVMKNLTQRLHIQMIFTGALRVFQLRRERWQATHYNNNAIVHYATNRDQSVS